MVRLLASIGCGLVMLGILSDAGGRTALAQSNQGAAKALAEDRPSFEVASVRPAPKDPSLLRDDPLLPRARSTGRFDAEARLRVVIAWAFGRPPTETAKTFRELDEVFAITAKAPGPVRLTGPYEVGPMNLMVQALLAERFKLRVRWEARNTPVFALRRTSTEQLGPKLKRIDPACPESYPELVRDAPDGCVSLITTGRGQVKGFVQMADLARFLSMFAGRRVVDDTGLVGRFELSMAFDPRSETDSSPLQAENLPTLRDALRTDLGFKLEPDRRDIQVLIIEHVEQPTEN